MDSALQINWCNYGQYKIIDVNKKHYEQVQQFMLEYFRSCRLFQVLKVQQEPGIENEFLKIVKHILRNESSIMVVDIETNVIKGVALLKCMSQEWRSWIDLQLLVESERFKELYDMVHWCLQQEFLRSKNISGINSLHLFAFHLCKELQENEEFLGHFFNAICEVGRHMLMPRVTCLSLSQNEQELMKSAGFEEMVRVVYSLYMFKKRRPFDRLRSISEMYGVFYAKKLHALVPYHEMLIKHVKGRGAEELGTIS